MLFLWVAAVCRIPLLASVGAHCHLSLLGTKASLFPSQCFKALHNCALPIIAPLNIAKRTQQGLEWFLAPSALAAMPGWGGLPFFLLLGLLFSQAHARGANLCFRHRKKARY